MKTIVVYHDKGSDWCADGYASACVVAEHLIRRGDDLSKVQWEPTNYGDPLPQGIDGAEVFVVDFSWKLPGMIELVSRAGRVEWIDHHKTSAKYAQDVQEAMSARSTKTEQPSGMWHSQAACGAVLAWHHLLFDTGQLPDILRYVDDRDRWQWKLDDSKAISAALHMVWSPQAHKPDPEFLRIDPAKLVAVGRSLLSAQAHRIEKKCRERAVVFELAVLTESLPVQERPEATEPVRYSDLRVMAVNTDTDISETGDWLCQQGGADIAVMYYHDGEKWVHSLRSRGEVDVSEIAKRYGGGGHAGAAGFRAFDVMVPKLARRAF